MESYEAHKVHRALKRGGILAFQLSKSFGSWQFTGQQGVDLLELVKKAMWANKEEEPSGGLMASLIELYGDGNPPHQGVDDVLAEIFYYANTRSGVAGVLEEVTTLIRNEGKTDLSKPWRECIIQVLTYCHNTVAVEKAAMQDLKSALRGVGEPATAAPAPDVEEGEE